MALHFGLRRVPNLRCQPDLNGVFIAEEHPTYGCPRQRVRHLLQQGVQLVAAFGVAVSNFSIDSHPPSRPITVQPGEHSGDALGIFLVRDRSRFPAFLFEVAVNAVAEGIPGNHVGFFELLADVLVKPVPDDVCAEMIYLIEDGGLRDAGYRLPYFEVVEQLTACRQKPAKHEQVIDGHGDEGVLAKDWLDLGDLFAHRRERRERLHREPDRQDAAESVEVELG